ncbi:Peptidoglycan N-acetylglucosamine deacetylase [Nocardiopsis sp. JB363]|nr:polysaccharide deacetylase family protein [Nocardiopsis sp. JB363]SIO90946.1 Peptidoglycan N-acetylglucosamine deacetylase [Nocardiopsis sp. JB363]
MHRAAVGGVLATTGLLSLTTLPAAAETERTTPDCDNVKCVALTFDDGPGRYTDELLDILDENDAKATFYLLGSKLDSYTEEVERMVDEDHEVGNHTWDHADLADLSAGEIKEDLDRTDKAIKDVTGQMPTTMRPPYGSLSDTARETIDKPMLLWDVDTLDWQHRDPETTVDIAAEETDEGSVLLFHDIHETTVDAIPDVLDTLSEDGYEFVTVDEMMGSEVESGSAYSDARSLD